MARLVLAYSSMAETLSRRARTPSGLGEHHPHEHDDAVERRALPDLGDEGESAQRQRQRRPDTAADRLVRREPRTQRHEDRSGELEEQRDADLEMLDGDEVEQLDEPEPDQAVHRDL